MSFLGKERASAVSRLPALFLKASFSAADAAGLFVVCCLGFGFPASYFIDSRMASASASSSVRLSVPMDEARLRLLVEHRHVLKLIVDEFLHEVTGLHRP